MFRGCWELTSLDVSNFDTSNVTDMESMFDSCKKLTSIDLSNFDTSNVRTMRCMFWNCDNLTTIYASNKFVTNNVTVSQFMFEGCTNLVGGNGTRYSSSSDDKTYARIDKAGTPGYFTEKPLSLSGEITANSITWNNGTATVTLETSSNLAIQYKSEESENWISGTTVTGLKNNDVIYARLTDGKNYSAETTINILY